MGLIKAGVGAAGGVLADSWREYFYCESIDENTLAVKGQKRTSNKGRSSNTKGTDNVISNGSIIAVADGQCMLIVEQGKVVDVCAEPGEFVYETDAEPSLFTGKLSDTIKQSFQEVGKRFTFGGDAPMDQRVIFINTKEIYGNKYGTPTPVPFRVVDTNINLDIDISVRCNGVFSYRITDPLMFYKNVCGNIEEPYMRNRLDDQIKSELLTSLQPAFARISEMGVRYSAVPAHVKELTQIINEELSETLKKRRGIEIEEFGMNSIAASPEDEERIKQKQAAATLRDPDMLRANLGEAQAEAMRMAAQNEGGAMNGFIGMGMASMAGAMGAQNQSMYGQQGGSVPPSNYPVAAGGGFAPPTGAPVAGVPAPAPAVEAWTCSCGAQSTGKFCGECGAKRPEPVAPDTWTCSCGAQNSGKFCGECGAKRPEANGPWTCSCGTENTGKFCGNCGSPRP